MSIRLTQARAPLTQRIMATDELGESQDIAIPAERALTLYLDKREIVTLMTLGVNPELLVLGYLLNQRLAPDTEHIESITVDWEAGDDGMGGGVAAVKTLMDEAAQERMAQRTAKRVVTTGCGQGSIFGGMLEDLDAMVLAPSPLAQSALFDILRIIREQDTTYKSSGSVHGCALFRVQSAPNAPNPALLLHHVEDVGRHNALDTLAGWMALQPKASLPSRDLVLYTTGRLTSEMVIKSAQMGVPFVVSRSGITQMGFDVAKRIGLGTIGRALNVRYLCYTGADRIAR